MRLIALILTALFLLTACGTEKKTSIPPNPPQLAQLFVSKTGDTISLNPETVKVVDRDVFLTIHFAKREIRDNIKLEVWEAVLRPSERLIAINSRKLFDTAGQEITSETFKTDWEYILPESTTEKIMRTVIEYCRTLNLPIDATPTAYATPGFQFVYKANDNNAFYFYKPTTIWTDGTTINVNVLIVNEVVQNGIDYTINKVQFKPSENKYRILSQTLYDPAGKKISTLNNTKWFDIPNHSVFDMMLDMIITYCRDNKIAVK